MKIEFIGKNCTVREDMKQRAERKLAVLNKYPLIREDTSARIVVSAYSGKQKIEVTIPTKVAILRAEVTQNDFASALDSAVDKLEDQIRRQKTRLSRRNKEKLAVAFLQEEDKEEKKAAEAPAAEDILVRTKTIQAEKMDLDEAIMRMEMLDHSFFIFTDQETEKISVVYKRLEGGYGCIETE